MPINPLWYMGPIFLALLGGVWLVRWGRRLWLRGESVGGGCAIGCGALLIGLSLLGWSATITVDRRVTITGVVAGTERIDRVQYVRFNVAEEAESSAFVRADLFPSVPSVGETRNLTMVVNRRWFDGNTIGYGIELPGAPPTGVGPASAFLSSQRVELLFGRGRPYRP